MAKRTLRPLRKSKGHRLDHIERKLDQILAILGDQADTGALEKALNRNERATGKLKRAVETNSPDKTSGK